MPTISLFLDDDDVKQFTAYLDSMSKRAARDEILPILKEHFEPLVASEKSFLSSHSQSGALEASLAARAGGGDRPGTISVFSAPSATSKQLIRHWSKGRKQQRSWAAGITGSGRKRVFYGPMVHQGHRVVVRNAAGELMDTGKVTAAVPFAQQAMDAMGDEQSEAAATAILDHIVGD